MTANEWKQQTDLLGKAIRGDEHAISEVCEFIDKYRRAAMMNRLSYAGAVCSIDEGYREVLLFVQYKLSRLKIVRVSS